MTNQRKNPFIVPVGYFSSLEKEILFKTKTNFSAYGFKTPKSYFKNLEEDIFEKTIGKNNSFIKSNFKYVFLSQVFAVSIFIYYSLSVSSETLIKKENKISFDDYIENYYLDELNIYEIISMLEEAEIDNTLKYDQIP